MCICTFSAPVASSSSAQLFDEAGDDHLAGNEDNDPLLGGPGADTLGGGKDDDVLDGGADVDHLDGKAGFDACIAGESLVRCEA